MSRDPLWHRLVDDAAVFPPGEAPWAQALSEHRRHRTAGYGEMVGPLLVPAARTSAFLAALDSEPVADERLRIVLIGDVDALAASVADLDGRAHQVEVVAVEVPPVPLDELTGVVASVVPLGVPVAWCEVPRGAHGERAVQQLAGLGRDDSPTRWGAKLRTGGTTADAVAPIGDLAAFLRATTGADMPFKLTAGLHHAVRGLDAVTGGTTHGVLNVVAAVDAVRDGADDAAVQALLAQTDPWALVERVTSLPVDRRRRVRGSWASFGCCGVTDPLRELAALGVLDADGLGATTPGSPPAPSLPAEEAS